MVTFHLVAHPQADDFSHYYDNWIRGRNLIAIKGAPEVVLPLCKSYQAMNDLPHKLDQGFLQKIYQANDAMTDNSLRVLALAYRDIKKKSSEWNQLEQDLVFVGLVGMADPARTEVKPAVENRAPCGNPNDHDHRRLCQHRARHRGTDRFDAPGQRSVDRR